MVPPTKNCICMIYFRVCYIFFLAGCSNKHSDKKCDDWAIKGECSVNPRWMKTNCRKSCRMCPDNRTTTRPPIRKTTVIPPTTTSATTRPTTTTKVIVKTTRPTVTTTWPTTTTISTYRPETTTESRTTTQRPGHYCHFIQVSITTFWECKFIAAFLNVHTHINDIVKTYLIWYLYYDVVTFLLIYLYVCGTRCSILYFFVLSVLPSAPAVFVRLVTSTSVEFKVTFPRDRSTPGRLTVKPFQRELKSRDYEIGTIWKRIVL